MTAPAKRRSRSGIGRGALVSRSVPGVAGSGRKRAFPLCRNHVAAGMHLALQQGEALRHSGRFSAANRLAGREEP